MSLRAASDFSSSRARTVADRVSNSSRNLDAFCSAALVSCLVVCNSSRRLCNSRMTSCDGSPPASCGLNNAFSAAAIISSTFRLSPPTPARNASSSFCASPIARRSSSNSSFFFSSASFASFKASSRAAALAFNSVLSSSSFVFCFRAIVSIFSHFFRNDSTSAASTGDFSRGASAVLSFLFSSFAAVKELRVVFKSFSKLEMRTPCASSDSRSSSHSVCAACSRLRASESSLCVSSDTALYTCAGGAGASGAARDSGPSLRQGSKSSELRFRVNRGRSSCARGLKSPPSGNSHRAMADCTHPVYKTPDESNRSDSTAPIFVLGHSNITARDLTSHMRARWSAPPVHITPGEILTTLRTAPA